MVPETRGSWLRSLRWETVCCRHQIQEPPKPGTGGKAAADQIRAWLYCSSAPGHSALDRAVVPGRDRCQRLPTPRPACSGRTGGGGDRSWKHHGSVHGTERVKPSRPRMLRMLADYPCLLAHEPSRPGNLGKKLPERDIQTGEIL